MAIFPDEPGLADFIGAEDGGSGGDNWSQKTCKAPVKSSPPTNQHPTFHRPEALPVAQPTVSYYCTGLSEQCKENVTFHRSVHPK